MNMVAIPSMETTEDNNVTSILFTLPVVYTEIKQERVILCKIVYEIEQYYFRPSNWRACVEMLVVISGFSLECHSGYALGTFFGKSILSLSWMVGMLYTIYYILLYCIIYNIVSLVLGS